MPRTDHRTSKTSLAILVGAVAVGAGVTAALVRRMRLAPLEVAPGFQLDRYMGTWYEIGRMPNFFERGCKDTTAHYARLADGSVQITNRCRRGRKWVEVRGIAWAPDAAVPARLTVQFRWPFRGDYQVLYVDGDYHVAVVGTRGRRQAWILCREPLLDEQTFQLCCDFLAEQGFDPGRLIRTAHPSRQEAPRGRVRPIASANPA